MKKYRIVVMIVLFIAGISCAIFWYQPLKENQVYEKELVLKEDTGAQVSKWDEEKLIIKAKDTFQTLLDFKIKESKYDAVVKFEIIALNAGDKEKKEVARVSFIEKKYSATEYIVAYDTETGELVELYSIYGDENNGTSKDEVYLEKIAKEFIFKVTELENNDIDYEAYIQGSTYFVQCTSKKEPKEIELYLNVYTGKVTFYQTLRQ